MSGPQIIVLVSVLISWGCQSSSEMLEGAFATSAEWESASVLELGQALEKGNVSAVELTVYFLDRIAAYDRSGPSINSVIEVNPEALAIAATLDAELAAGQRRSPLHGIPVLLKANIDTGDRMATHAGSLALREHMAADDAFHVQALRDSGAIILGKTNLSEWANFRSSDSVSGWSSIGGQTRNPHVLDRNPCGSSSGSGAAVAAGLAPLAIGTETDGSIVCPASINGIVGLKPTVGLVSRDGIIPIAITQDTAGPMAPRVRDVAYLLAAIDRQDQNDPALDGHPGERRFLGELNDSNLTGLRIGVWRDYYGAGNHPRVTAIFDRATGELESLGATLVDPLNLNIPGEIFDAEYEVLLYEFKAGLNAYLASAGLNLSLADIIAFNTDNAALVMPHFGQDIMNTAQAKTGLDDPAYQNAREQSHVAMDELLRKQFESHALDLLVVPTNAPAWPIDYVAGDRFSLGSSSAAAVSGWPSITLPAGTIASLPIGVSLVAPPWREDRLLRVAFALEQRLKRPLPSFIPSLETAEAQP